nr:hypothetical protein A5888_002575 [Enterococcus sp. 9E7_DIV0242]
MKEQWREENRYEIDGIYTQDGKAMIFDLNDFREYKVTRKKNS